MFFVTVVGLLSESVDVTVAVILPLASNCTAPEDTSTTPVTVAVTCRVIDILPISSSFHFLMEKAEAIVSLANVEAEYRRIKTSSAHAYCNT